MAKAYLVPLAAAPLSALALCAAFPPLEWGWVVWVALVPVLLLLKVGGGGAPLWAGAGFAYGAVFYAIQYAWITRTLLELGGMGPVRFTAFAVLLLVMLAAFPAAMFAGARWLWQNLNVSPYCSLPVLLAVHDALLGVLPFGGMPWGSLASTQTAGVGAAVLAPLAGGSALVWLIGAVNAAWARAAEALARGRRIWVRGVVTAAVVTVVAASPWNLLGSAEPNPVLFSALLVPGNFPTPDPGAEAVRGRMRHFLTETFSAWPSNPVAKQQRGAGTLVLWPEAALGGSIPPAEAPKELVDVAAVMEADFLFGADTERDGGAYNAAFLVTRRPADFQRYEKRSLVPFGEYVPSGFGWAFGPKVARGEGDYRPGTEAPVVAWGPHKLGVAICFESVLPGHARAAARAGAEVLVVMANDQWLTVAARTQHLRLSGLRGLEIGRDVVFVANGGWNAHMGGGSLLAVARWDQNPIWVRPHLREPITPWVRYGYGPLIFLLAAWGLVSLMISLLPQR